MKTYGKASMAVVASALCSCAGLAVAAELPAGLGATHRVDRVMVRFDPSATEAMKAAAHAKAGMKSIVAEIAPLLPGLFVVEVPMGTVDEAVRAYGQMPGVAYAELDYVRTTHAQDQPYGIAMVNAPQVWPTTTGTGAKVAVLDTGVDLLHPDLPTPVAMASFITGQAVDDLHSHGTHCSGTVLALNNTDGVIGVAPTAQLMIGKVLSNAGSGSDSSVLQGVNWAVANGADVISMSLGGSGYSLSFEQGAAAAVAANVTVLASAGNSNSDIPSYPGSYPAIICVAAVDENQVKASFSNFGPTVDITAPGVNVLSSVPTISANATFGGTTRGATVLSGSATGTVNADIVYCQDGNEASDFPAAVSGKIAHIRRGSFDGSTVTFFTKVTNALEAGAVGVIISNNTGTTATFAGNINANAPVPVVSISKNNGDALVTLGTTPGTIFVGRTGSGYANYSGTSMSCPHVAGVAALLYSAGEGRATAALVRAALESTATDLGTAGRDDIFGHGLVNAQAAVNYLLANLPACTSDFDGDGDTGTDADIEAFFACLAGTCCTTCGSADFDGDGDTGTDADIEAFFRVLAGGAC